MKQIQGKYLQDIDDLIQKLRVASASRDKLKVFINKNLIENKLTNERKPKIRSFNSVVSGYLEEVVLCTA